jgi:LCP family protein required for cell wall assembly
MSEPGETQPAEPEVGTPSEPEGSVAPEASAPLADAPTATGKGSPKGRSPILAASLSFVWPGLGQLYGRRRIAALIFAVPVVIATIWLVLQVLNGVLYFGASFLDSSFALTFVIGGAVLGVWRVASMFHAYATTGPRRRPRILDSAVLAILLVIVVAAHGELVYYAWSVYSFDVDISNNVIVPNTQPTSGPSTLAMASPTPSPTPVWQPGGSLNPNPTPQATPSAAPSHRITILLTGIDWLPGRTSSMDDAIMLVSLDTDTGKVAMVSIPRDTAYFDYYWGGTTGINTKINNFANLVAKGLIHAPDPSFSALANEVGFLVGVKVDYYAAIDMANFPSLVNALPGHDVCVYNAKAIIDPSTQTYIGSGNICLNGGQALKYARSRHNGGNDYVRAGRQQDLMLAAARKLATPSGIIALPKVLSLGAKLIQTNFPLNTAKNYVSIVQHLGTGDVTQCVLGPPYDYHPASTLTKGDWTSRLKLSMVSSLSVYLFGTDSRYYGMEGVAPASCGH